MKWKWGYLFKVMYEALLCVCAASFGYITHEMMNFQDRSFPFLFLNLILCERMLIMNFIIFVFCHPGYSVI